MSVTKDDVKKVARLSRIAVPEVKLETLAGELSGIMGWIEQLNEVDVEGVEPMTSVVAAKLPMRDDVVSDGSIQEQVLAKFYFISQHKFWNKIEQCFTESHSCCLRIVGWAYFGQRLECSGKSLDLNQKSFFLCKETKITSQNYDVQLFFTVDPCTIKISGEPRRRNN